MNSKKAHDHFSDYFEGTLEKGLKASLERALQDDPHLAAEYRAFEATMVDLGHFGKQEVQHPEDLFDKISASVDRLAWEQKRSAPTWFQGWMRFGFLATAVVAVVGLAVVQGIKSNQVSNVTTASIVGTNSAGSLEILPTNDGVVFSYPSGSNHQIVISRSTGEVIDTLSVSKDTYIKNKPLMSSSDAPQIVKVTIDDKEVTWIALPGRQTQSNQPSEGTIKEFALAVAGHHRVPVVVQVQQDETPISWKLSADNVMDSVASAFATGSPKGELKQLDGKTLLWISKN